MKHSVKTKGIIVCTGVPAPLKAPSSRPSPPFLKSLFPLSSFLFHPLLRYFRQTPTLLQPPSCPTRTTNLPWFTQISKEWFYYFTSSTVAFYQKSIFNLLNPFTNREINLNLYGIIFRFIFRQLRMTFFSKIMVEHNTTYNTILKRIK